MAKLPIARKKASKKAVKKGKRKVAVKAPRGPAAAA